MKKVFFLLAFIISLSQAVKNTHSDTSDGEWRRGEKGATCADTCGVLTCDPDKPASLTSQEKVADAFEKAGYTCKGFGGHRDYAGAPLSTGRAGRDCYWFSPHDGSKSSTCFSNKYSSNAPLCFCRPNALQIQFDHLEAEVEQLKNLIENEGTDCSDCDHPNEPPATCAVIFPRSPENPNGVDCETVVEGCRHFTSVEACYEASVGFFSENARADGALDNPNKPPGCSMYKKHQHNFIEFNKDFTANPSVRQICQCDVGAFTECTDGSRLQWYSSAEGYETIPREP